MAATLFSGKKGAAATKHSKSSLNDFYFPPFSCLKWKYVRVVQDVAYQPSCGDYPEVRAEDNKLATTLKSLPWSQL